MLQTREALLASYDSKPSPTWHRDESLASIVAVELVGTAALDDDGAYDDEHEEAAGGEAKDVVVRHWNGFGVVHQDF